MLLMKVVIFTTLLVANRAAPGYESHSFGHYGPVATIAHAPTVSYSHRPRLAAPVELERHAPAHYEFKYGVRDDHTHDIKEQAEKRDGDKVEGYYSLVEPDGTTRIVHYTADHHNGFNAVVTKSGHAVHPATSVHTPAPAPSYRQAAPLVSYSHAPSYPHAASPVSFSHAPSYSHAAPLATYSHAAPAVSYSNTVGHGYTAEGVGHGHSLGHGYGH